MKKIMYAVQIEDKFVAFGWDHRMEWEDIFKSDLNEGNVKDILFEGYESALNRMNALISDLEEFESVDDIKLEDIEKIKVVKIEFTFECKIVK